MTTISTALTRTRTGELSHEEYVINAGYMTQQAREGIFRASDSNHDGSVSRQEYVLNRKITDEAKAIMARMDKNEDGKISQKEFIEHSGVEDKAAATSIFEMLDTNADGVTVTPEYLRVWGGWARSEIPKNEAGTTPKRARRNTPPNHGGLPDLLSQRGISIGDRLPNLPVYSPDGTPQKLHDLIGDSYTVIVGGCLTCPQFLRRYPAIEAVAKDYTVKGVKFYYLYRALAHPENNGYVKPFTLKERLMHVAEAKGKLKTDVPWIADGMDNALKKAMGNVNNPAFLLRSNGEIVHLQTWSDGEQLRKVLTDLVGPVEKPTRIDDLQLPKLTVFSQPKNKAVPRIETPNGMTPVQITPAPDAGICYVKLRAEVESSVLENGSGKIYLGFHVDPIHDVHWTNLVAPMKFKITSLDGAEATPKEASAAKVNVETDIAPREFLVDLRNAKAG